MPALPDPTKHPAKVRIVVTDAVALQRVLTVDVASAVALASTA